MRFFYLLSFDDVEFDFFFVAQTSQIFVGIIFDNRRLKHFQYKLKNCEKNCGRKKSIFYLMYEDVFVLIGPINKTVAVFHVKPFDFAFYAFG